MTQESFVATDGIYIIYSYMRIPFFLSFYGHIQNNLLWFNDQFLRFCRAICCRVLLYAESNLIK